MFAMVEVVIHVDEASFIRVAVGFDVSQQFDLIQCLVHVILVVEDHLQAVSLLLVGCGQIFHLDCLGKLGLAQHTYDLEPTSQHLVDDYGDLSLLFEASLFSIVDELQFMAIVYNPSRFQRVDIRAIAFYLTQCVTFVIEADTGRQFGGHLIDGVVTTGSFDLVPSGEVGLWIWDFFDRSGYDIGLRVFVVFC